MSVKLIEFNNVSFSYGTNKVLDNVSLEIEEGTYLGLIGPNGGGKSTLIELMLGLLEPDSGTINIQGKQIQKALDEIRIGYVPQRISQDYLELPATVYEIVESGVVAKSNILGKSVNKEAITESLEITGIEDISKQLIGNLSGGQRQKAFVARALAIKPQILVLDEPFVGIDLKSQTEFYELLKELNHKKITIIFISHDLDMISNQADEILCLNHKIIYSGKASEVDEKKLVEDAYGKEFTHIHHDY